TAACRGARVRSTPPGWLVWRMPSGPRPATAECVAAPRRPAARTTARRECEFDARDRGRGALPALAVDELLDRRAPARDGLGCCGAHGIDGAEADHAVDVNVPGDAEQARDLGLRQMGGTRADAVGPRRDHHVLRAAPGV